MSISQRIPGDARRSICRTLRIDSMRLNVLEQQQTCGGGAGGPILIGGHLILFENMLFVSARGRPCRGTDHGYQARLSIVVQMLSLTGLHVVAAPLKLISQTMIGDACRSIRRALRIDSTRLNVLEQQQRRGGGAWGSILICRHFIFLKTCHFAFVCSDSPRSAAIKYSGRFEIK